MTDTLDNQIENTKPIEKPKKLYKNNPSLWKKGQSGNPKGRPKGKTMKEYVRGWLERMTDEERDAFLDGIPKEIIWKMSDGNPSTDVDLTSKGEKVIFMPMELLTKHKLTSNATTPTADAADTSAKSDSTGQPQV